jgi:hypothetical protein
MDDLGVAVGRPPLAQQSQDPASHEIRVPGSADDLVRVFHVQHATTDQDLQELSLLLQVTADIHNQFLFTCSAPRAVVARAAAGQIRVAEWLVDGLDKPPDWQPRTAPGGLSTPYESRLPGAPDDVARVVYLSNTTTSNGMQEVGQALRVIASLRKVFFFDSLQALVLRGTAGEMALAEWLLADLAPPASGQQHDQTPAHEHWAPDPHGDNLTLVYHLQHAIADRDAKEIHSLIRAKIGLPNLVVCTAPNAVTARGTASRIALAEQLIKEWDQPHPPRRCSLRSGILDSSTVLPGAPLAQFFRIAKVPGAAGMLFVAKQVRTANEVRGDPVQLSFRPRRPRFVERDAGDGSQQIDTVGLHSQLDHFVG